VAARPTLRGAHPARDELIASAVRSCRPKVATLLGTPPAARPPVNKTPRRRPAKVAQARRHLPAWPAGRPPPTKPATCPSAWTPTGTTTSAAGWPPTRRRPRGAARAEHRSPRRERCCRTPPTSPSSKAWLQRVRRRSGVAAPREGTKIASASRVAVFAVAVLSSSGGLRRPTPVRRAPEAGAAAPLRFAGLRRRAAAIRRPRAVATHRPRAAAETGTRPRRPPQFTVLGAGDILLHPALWDQGRADARAAAAAGFFFDPISLRPCPTSRAPTSRSATWKRRTARRRPVHRYRSRGPAADRPHIHDIGYDTCSTRRTIAGPAARPASGRTLDALDAAGVRHAGTAARQPSGHDRHARRTRGEGRAAVLLVGFNGLRGPTRGREPHRVKAILAGAPGQAAGAEVVILSLHWAPNTTPGRTPARSRWPARCWRARHRPHLGCHAPWCSRCARSTASGWVPAWATSRQPGFSLPNPGRRDAALPFTETTPGHFHRHEKPRHPTFVDLSGPIRLIDLPRASRPAQGRPRGPLRGVSPYREGVRKGLPQPSTAGGVTSTRSPGRDARVTPRA